MTSLIYRDSKFNKVDKDNLHQAVAETKNTNMYKCNGVLELSIFVS